MFFNGTEYIIKEFVLRSDTNVKQKHAQYLTVSKSYSDNCTYSLTEQNTTLKNLYYGLIQIKNKT